MQFQFIFLISFFFLVSDVSARSKCEALFLPTQKLKTDYDRDRQKIAETRKLLDSLKSNAKIKKNLFSHNFSDANQSSTIESHTVDVYTQFLKQARQLPRDSVLHPLMELIIALHDIGKPDAVAAGDRNRQHEFTILIMKDVLVKSGWSALNIKRAVAMVTYPGFSQLLKNERSAFQVAQDFLKLAQELELSPMELFKFKKAYYLSDAGAYYELRNTLFKENPKFHLEEKSPLMLEVEYWISGADH